jgi:DNA-binding NtrC family response regulator
VDFAERYKTAPVQLDDEARQRLMNYPFPGNVRELKNIAEQISVLAVNKQVNSREVEKFIPAVANEGNRLPVLAHVNGEQHEFNNEREILYKLFFDMKRDVTELKKLMFDIMQNPAVASQHASVLNEVKELPTRDLPAPVLVTSNSSSGQPVMMHHGNGDIHEHEEVEESLNIMDKEKELIVKALKKHRGKRKDAAMDLGISERTLYRKLKEYDIDQ